MIELTVITAVYNAVETIENTILSVIQQNEQKNIEYIIIDGGSTDGTLEIIKKYEHAISYFVSEPDNGIYAAWNKGLKVSRGEWIAFLGADDTYVPNAITSYFSEIKCFEAQKKIEYISSQNAFIKDNKVIRIYGAKWNWKKFSKYMNVAHVGSFHHRSLFEKYGYFDESYKICGDYELLLRATDQLKVHFFSKITVRMSVGGVSNSQLKLSFEEMKRAKCKAGYQACWVSKLESLWGYCKSIIRSKLWY